MYAVVEIIMWNTRGDGEKSRATSTINFDALSIHGLSKDMCWRKLITSS